MSEKTVKIISAGLLLLAVLGMGLYYRFTYARYENTEEPPRAEGVFLYTVDHEFGELNRIYAAAEDLKIENSLKKREAVLSDAPDLAALEGVSRLYIWDEAYFTDSQDAILAGSQQVAYSAPAAIFSDFAEPSGLWMFLRVAAGEAPKDRAGEIVLSAERLLRDYGISDAPAAIGRTLKFGEENYRLSGILEKGDFAWISFEEGQENLFYTYDPATFDGFVQKTEAYIRRVDGAEDFTAYLACTFPKGETPAEGATPDTAVLNALLQRYPASNYLSTHFSVQFRNGWNNRLLIHIFIVDVCIMVITASLCVFLRRRFGNPEEEKKLRTSYWR